MSGHTSAFGTGPLTTISLLENTLDFRTLTLAAVFVPENSLNFGTLTPAAILVLGNNLSPGSLQKRNRERTEAKEPALEVEAP